MKEQSGLIPLDKLVATSSDNTTVDKNVGNTNENQASSNFPHSKTPSSINASLKRALKRVIDNFSHFSLISNKRTSKKLNKKKNKK